MKERTNHEYREGELEIILSLAPTANNIMWLSKLLGRSESAIKIVYKIAFEHGPFAQQATAQNRKILEAKKQVGIVIGRKKLKVGHGRSRRELENPSSRGS